MKGFRKDEFHRIEIGLIKVEFAYQCDAFSKLWVGRKRQPSISLPKIRSLVHSGYSFSAVLHPLWRMMIDTEWRRPLPLRYGDLILDQIAFASSNLRGNLKRRKSSSCLHSNQQHGACGRLRTATHYEHCIQTIYPIPFLAAAPFEISGVEVIGPMGTLIPRPVAVWAPEHLTRNL